jgi:hypothetical protein
VVYYEDRVESAVHGRMVRVHRLVPWAGRSRVDYAQPESSNVLKSCGEAIALVVFTPSRCSSPSPLGVDVHEEISLQAASVTAAHRIPNPGEWVQFLRGLPSLTTSGGMVYTSLKNWESPRIDEGCASAWDTWAIAGSSPAVVKVYGVMAKSVDARVC